MKYKCATYGDACIATLLEMIMLHFVAPRIDDKLGKELALVKRYVDDIIGSGDDRDKLVVAMLSLERALISLGFTLKKIISNNFWHFSIPNLSSLGAAWQPEPNPESIPEEVIFGHQWNIKSDTLRPNFKLYTGKKSRGTYTGDVLEKTDLKNVVITKRLMASLCAQIFELDGCWSSILKTHFKILFQKTCQVTSSWSENVTHSQIGIEILSFLAILKDKIKLIPSLPRCIIPPGFEVYQINTFSDGSATCSSFTIFLAMASRSSRRSVLAKASSKSKHHSVPCMEAIGVWLGVESTAKYFTSHMQVFRKVRRISFSLDS